MKILFFFVLVSSFVFSSATPHPIYVSNTEVNYKQKEKKIEISVKVFSNDLQEAISQIKGEMIEIGTDREHRLATDYIIEYFNNYFTFEINGRTRKYVYVHRELIKEDFYSTYILLKIEKLKKIKSIVLTNKLLIDAFPTQQNIVSFMRDGVLLKKCATDKDKISVELF